MRAQKQGQHFHFNCQNRYCPSKRLEMVILAYVILGLREACRQDENPTLSASLSICDFKYLAGFFFCCMSPSFALTVRVRLGLHSNRAFEAQAGDKGPGPFGIYYY